MHLEKGSPQDARQIAMIFYSAFPESIELFYGSKALTELFDLLELSFKMIFYWGGQALVAKDERGNIVGYCFYRSSHHRPTVKQFVVLLGSALKMLSKVSFGEACKLAHNKLVMIGSAQRNKKGPKPQAHIVSIAVNPSQQGQGLGKSLLNHTLHQLQGQTVALNVRSTNLAAQHLYAEAGFSEYGKTKDLLGDWLRLLRKPS